MAYVGTPIDTTNQFQSLQGKRFSGNASTTAFTLDIAPSSVFDIEVFVENVRQDPNSAYSLSGTTLTFAAAPPSGTNNIYVVHQAKAVGTINPTNDSVTASSIADDAVESEHLNNNIISGQTALAAEPADTDEFLVSDAGVIKRIDYSLIKGQTMTPAFQSYASMQIGVSDNTATKVDFSNELFDTGGCYDTSNKRFTPTTAGKYYIYSYVEFNAVGVDKFHSCHLYIYKNGSAYKTVYYDEYDNYTAYAITPFIGAAIDFNGSSDYVEIYGNFNVTSGTNHRFTGGSESSFGGYRIIGA
jgi:hypothetical protein